MSFLSIVFTLVKQLGCIFKPFSKFCHFCESFWQFNNDRNKKNDD